MEAKRAAQLLGLTEDAERNRIVAAHNRLASRVRVGVHGDQLRRMLAEARDTLLRARRFEEQSTPPAVPAPEHLARTTLLPESSQFAAHEVATEAVTTRVGHDPTTSRWGRVVTLANALLALSLFALALGINVWVGTMVRSGFSGVGPAYKTFGRPNVNVPPSGAVPVAVSDVGRLTGFAAHPPPMLVDIRLTRLDRGTQTLFITADITVPEALLTAIPGRQGHPAVRGSSGSYYLTRAGRGLSLPFRVYATYGDGLAYHTRLPLDEIVQDVNDNNTALRISFDAPLQGAPGEFPSDWYELANDVVIWPPTSWAIPGDAGVPVRLAVSAGPAMSGFRMRMVSKPQVDASFLRLAIVTANQTRDLGYIVALVPLLLGIVALAVAGLRRRDSQKRLVQELGMPVLLGILAVLPIRQVVVPSDLPGLTRIDLLLAFGITLAVGVLLAAFALEVRTRARVPVSRDSPD